MNSQSSIVIVGAGLAGASAATALRSRGFDGAITLLGAESALPYNRPPLSKGFLRGEKERDTVFVEGAEKYSEQRIDLVLGAGAIALDVEAHTVELSDGRQISYDRLLLATGASARRSTLPGAELVGVHYLRTLDDSVALRDELASGKRRLVVLGAGWIGMEVAASARVLGNEVTVVHRGEAPLAHALGMQIGRFMAGVHIANGADVRSNSEATRIIGDDGRVAAVDLGNGVTVPADLVVIAIGATPNVALAVEAGLEVGDGILVDSALRTSSEHVFAAGDVASIEHPLRPFRVRNEHWSNAVATGTAAADSLLGMPVIFDDIPSFVSSQFDITLGYSGFSRDLDGASVTYRGDPQSKEFMAFWHHDGIVVGSAYINTSGVSAMVQALIRSGGRVDPVLLSDDTRELSTVLA